MEDADRVLTIALDGENAWGSYREDARSLVYELFTGSWIDESASAAGVDLGTWIGEDEENRGWELLGRARDFLDKLV